VLRPAWLPLIHAHVVDFEPRRKRDVDVGGYAAALACAVSLALCGVSGDISGRAQIAVAAGCEWPVGHALLLRVFVGTAFWFHGTGKVVDLAGFTSSSSVSRILGE
jgi:hypothetical protein